MFTGDVPCTIDNSWLGLAIYAAHLLVAAAIGVAAFWLKRHLAGNQPEQKTHRAIKGHKPNSHARDQAASTGVAPSDESEDSERE